MLNTDPRGFLYRFVAGLAGLTLISLGMGPLILRGDLFYTNWLGELVFAPLAVTFGVIAVWFAFFKPEWLAARRIEKKRR